MFGEADGGNAGYEPEIVTRLLIRYCLASLRGADPRTSPWKGDDIAIVIYRDKILAVEGLEPSIPKAINFESIAYFQFRNTALTTKLS